MGGDAFLQKRRLSTLCSLTARSLANLNLLSKIKQRVDAPLMCLYASSMFIVSKHEDNHIYIKAWALHVARQTIGAMRDALSSETSNRYSTRASFCIMPDIWLYIMLVGCCKTGWKAVMYEQQNKKRQRLHIGSLIKAELERQERTVSWFARKLSCDRSNVYKLFKRSTVDTELLLRVSSVLNYNFFEVYTDEANGIIGHRSVDSPASAIDRQ